MGWGNMFRRAEEQARKAARAGLQRTIAGLDDAERASRRRMRIYPKRVQTLPLQVQLRQRRRGLSRGTTGTEELPQS